MSMHFRAGLWAVAGVSLWVLGVPALAAPVLVVNSDAGIESTSYGSGDYVGWAFYTTEDVTITHLGVYDQNGDGIAAPTTGDNTWMIWYDWRYHSGVNTGDGHLVTSAAIPSTGGTLIDDTRFFALATPFVLTANPSSSGNPYMVMVNFANTANKHLKTSPNSTPPEGTTADDQAGVVTFEWPWGEIYANPATDWFSTTSSINISTPSFQLLPEPMTMALLALGGVGMLIRRRQSK